MNIKRFVMYCFREPVVGINVGRNSKIKYFVIPKGEVETFTNKKEAMQHCKSKAANEKIVIKGIIL